MENDTNIKIVQKNCSELIGAEYNPRELTEKQHKDLTDSLKRFGIVDPVLVNVHPDRENIIVGGHQRTRVWQELGNTTIPCVEINLTLDQEKELNIRLNKNTGQFDFDMLANHYEQEDLIEFGFDSFEFGVLEDSEELEFPDLGNGEDSPIKTMSFTVSVEQSETIELAIKKAKTNLECIDAVNENSNGNALSAVLKKYLNE